LVSIWRHVRAPHRDRNRYQRNDAGDTLPTVARFVGIDDVASTAAM